jgi:hypothetical protein
MRKSPSLFSPQQKENMYNYVGISFVKITINTFSKRRRMYRRIAIYTPDVRTYVRLNLQHNYS